MLKKFRNHWQTPEAYDYYNKIYPDNSFTKGERLGIASFTVIGVAGECLGVHALSLSTGLGASIMVISAALPCIEIYEAVSGRARRKKIMQEYAKHKLTSNDLH